MLNTALNNINSTSDDFSLTLCLNGIYAEATVGFIAMSFCFFLGTPAHSWHLWLFLHTGSKIKPTQVFPLNRTILELIYSIQSAPHLLNQLIFNSNKVRKVVYFLVSISWIGRPLMQICISIERYLAVIHPIIFLQYKGLQYRIASTAVAWLMAAVWAVHVTFEGDFVEHIFNFIFFITIIVISFCCVSVLRALKHPGPGDTQISVERGRDVGNQQKRKAFNTIFTGLLIILFTYLPQVLLGLIIVIENNDELYYCRIAPFMNTFNILGMMITPVLKIYKNCCVNLTKGNKREIVNNPASVMTLHSSEHT